MIKIDETIDKELNILILEDIVTDVELIEQELRKAGIIFSSKHVWTKEAFLKELKDFAPDLILADYSLPQFDGISALAIAKERCPDVPFILVSGVIGEELAVEVLKSGATDYVLKHRLSRLVPSVRRALTEAEERTERKRAEEALRESEGKLNAMIQSIGDHMSMIDKDLNVIWANERAKKVFGNGIIGRKCYEVYHGRKEPCKPYPCSTLKAFQDGKVHEHDTQVLDKNGRIIYFHCTANAALRDKEGKPSAVIEISRDITERKIAEEELRKYQEQLRSLASQLSLVEERERHRIATELHDHIGQTLALCQIKLGALRESASPTLAVSVDGIRDLIDQTIHYTRSLTSELSPPILYELGFEAAVEWLGEQILTRHGIQFYFENDGQKKPMEDEARVLLFQAVRELMVNVAKHSQARNSSVYIRRDGNNIQIKVEDDGVGFDTSKLESYLKENSGFGLFSIRERLNRIRGYLNIESEPGKGTRVTIVTPLKI